VKYGHKRENLLYILLYIIALLEPLNIVVVLEIMLILTSRITKQEKKEYYYT